MEFGILKVGDEITTNIGNKYIVGKIIKRPLGNDDGHLPCEWVIPKGEETNEYAYWIPVRNIISFERK